MVFKLENLFTFHLEVKEVNEDKIVLLVSNKASN